MKFSHGWMEDTHPEALRIFLELNHRLPAQQKFDRINGMYESPIGTWAAQERKLHPEASEREVFLRVAARRLGSDLVRRAYGWAPG